MRDKFKVLQEDDAKIYNKWVKGMAKQDGPSQVITVDDIINRYRNTVSYNCPKNLPYGMDNLLSQIGNLFYESSVIRLSLGKAVTNPVIYESKNKTDAVKTINEEIEKIQHNLFSITDDMNKILENKEK